MKRSLFLLIVGGTSYPLLELLWRGKTSPCMSISGGVCLCLIDKICDGPFKRRSFFSRCVVGSAIITGVEFFVGVWVNLITKQRVWDYSNLPGNFLGQICLPFSILWFFLSMPAIGLCRLCDRKSRRSN